MTPLTPAAGATATSWRAARREVARTHHPDLGGQAAAYLRELAAVDAAHGVSPSGAPLAVVVRSRAPWARLAGALHRGRRWWRASTIRRRHYVDL